MSSTSNVQNLLVNVFRPVYQYDANTGTFTTKLNLSNIDVIEANSVAGAQIALGDVNSNLYLGSNSGNASDSLRNCVGNTAVGYEAGRNISNVSNSIYIGLQAGANVTNSANIIAIGCNAAGVGTSNIYLGNTSGSSGTGISNIYLGHGITTSNASNDLRIGMGVKTMIAGDTSTNWVGLGGSLAPAYLSNSVDVSGNLYISGKVGIQVEPNNKSLNVNGGAVFNDGKGIFTIGTDASNNMVVQMESTSGGAGMFIVKGGDVSATRINSDFLSVTYLDISGVSTALVGATDVCTNSLRAVDISTTVIRAGPGSASAPAYSFRTDTSSGMFLQGTSQVGFSTAGLQRMTLSNGNVGIGIVSPSNKLDISYDTRSGTHSSNLALYATKISASNTDPIAVIAHANGSAGVGFGYNSVMAVGANVSNDLHLYSKGNGNITFNDVSTTNLEKVRIVGSNGNVGIGTTAPSQKLHVVGTILSDTSLLVVPNSSYLARYSSNDSIYALNNVHTDAGYFMGVSESQYMGTGTQAALVTSSTLAGLHVIRESSVLTGLIFKTNSGGALERMRITGAGNVGIGATIPAYALDICGALRASGSIYGSNLGIGNSNPAYAIDVCGTVRASSNLFVTSNVGIGTTTLSNYKLSIRGSGGTTGFIVFHQAAANNPYVGIGYDETLDAFTVRRNFGSSDLNDTMMTVKRGTGNVGLGTTAPTATLDVSGTANIPNFVASNYIRNALTPTTFDISGGNIRMSNGSVSVPSYSFITDASLGIYRLGANQLGFTSAGVHRMIISNDSVGIGTTVPTTTLDVSGNVRTGFLGVGTLNTGSWNSLEVNGSTRTTGTLLVNAPGNSFAYSKFQVGDRITNDNSRIWPSAQPGLLTHQTQTSTVLLNDSLPVLGLGRQGSGTVNGALSTFKISRYVNGGTGNNGSKTRMDIDMTDDAFNDVNVMTMYSEGKVGILRSNPSYTLDVCGTTNTSNLLAGGYIRNALIPTQFDISGGNVRMSNGSVSVPSYSFISDASLGMYRVGANQLAFTSAGLQRMTISNANVGIGTTAPGSVLDVSGTTRSTALRISNVGGATTGFVNANIQSSSYGVIEHNGTYILHSNGQSNNALVSFPADAPGGTNCFMSNNVGIGIRSTTNKLDISYDIRSNVAHSSNLALYATKSTSTNTELIAAIAHGNGSAGIGFGWNSVMAVGVNASNDLNLYSKGNGNITFNDISTTNLEKMRIVGSNSHVGIGTTNPAYRLDVCASAGVASINMTSWPRTTISNALTWAGKFASFATGCYNLGSSLCNTMDSNLITFVGSNTTQGMNWRINKSGIWAISFWVYNTADNQTALIDVCNNVNSVTYGDAATAPIAWGVGANYRLSLAFTGYLSSNANGYYKIRASGGVNPTGTGGANGTLSITFLQEMPNMASGTFPINIQ